MTPSAHRSPVRTSRPTDATGLFWGFVSLFFGLVFFIVFPALTIVVIALALPFCIQWQIRKWQSDSAIVFAATEWCDTHYPEADRTPLVDFMIAFCHVTGADLRNILPSTSFDDVQWVDDDGEWPYWYPEAKNRTQAILSEILSEARIEAKSLAQFTGSNIDDAIRLMQQSRDVQ